MTPSVTDLAGLLALALIRPYTPEIIPGNVAHYPQGFAVNFTGSQDIDTAHSFGYYFQTADYGVVTPTRVRGSGFLSETFVSPSGWGSIITGSAAADIIDTPNFNGGGRTLRLRSGATNGSVAGYYKFMGALGGDFSLALLYWPVSIGHYFDSAAEVILQNASGKYIWCRIWDGHIQTYMDGQWFTASTGSSAISPNEIWLCAVDKGGGQHELNFYQGTQQKWSRTGVLDNGPTGQNNGLFIKQQSVSENYREFWVAQVNCGVTQLADDMTLCSKLAPYPITAPPTTGKLLIIVEDVSASIVINDNFSARISRDDCANWANVPLAEITKPNGEPFLYGRIDNSKPNRMFYGEADFCGAADTKVRWALDSTQGFLPAMGGVSMGWA